MARIVRNLAWTLAIGWLFLAGASPAKGQVIVSSYYYPSVSSYYPSASYYYPVQTAAYYYPSVAYYPSVSYPVGSVSYYAAPAVSYYPGAMTTTRYGLFGQPRVRTSYYPGYVYP